MSFVIHPLSEADYASAAELCNTAVLDRLANASDWLRADHAAEPMRRTGRYAAVDAVTRRLVGYGAFWHVRLQKWRLDIVVAEAQRRRGIGSLLLRRIVDGLRVLEAATVQARAREDAAEVLSFLHNRDFQEVHRMVDLRLAVAEVDLFPLQHVVEHVLQRGITITTLADEQARVDDSWEKLHTLHNAALPGWPDPDPGPLTPISVSDLLQQMEQLNVIPDAFFIARLGERYLGYSGLAVRHDGAPDSLDSGGTAVHPEYRRQGLATALKIRTIEYARAHDYTTLATRSASPGMVALNERLGFRRGLAEVRLIKAL